MAMGWENDHHYEFIIRGERCRPIETWHEKAHEVDEAEDVAEWDEDDLDEDDFDDSGCANSETIMFGKLLPRKGRTLKFKYIYDFGDSWEHEIVFEGCPPIDPQAQYPLCLEGERACPPEDCGGIGSYWHYLEWKSNPDRDENDGRWDWWGDFDPEKFDVNKATKNMRKYRTY